MKSIDIKNGIDLVKKWLIRSHLNIQVHYRTANYISKYHYWIGIPLMIFTIILGSELLDLIFDEAIVKIIKGFLGLTAAILAGMQTFLKLEERKESHIKAAQRYGEIVRKLEKLTAFPDEISQKTLDSIEDKINKTVNESVVPPDKLFKKENEKLRKFYGE